MTFKINQISGRKPAQRGILGGSTLVLSGQLIETKGQHLILAGAGSRPPMLCVEVTSVPGRLLFAEAHDCAISSR